MALINLVVNAVHAMGEKGGTLTVMHPPPRATTWRCRWPTRAPGSPSSIRGNLFEPFVTTKPEGKGTGLGLSTVLMVVERHNGRVDFDTDRGAGHDLPDHAAAGPAVAAPGSRGRHRGCRRRRYSETVSWPRSTSAAFPDSRQQ